MLQRVLAVAYVLQLLVQTPGRTRQWDRNRRELQGRVHLPVE
jgi:uncharacterized protein HemY